MTRNSTPIEQFRLPSLASEYSHIRLTFGQDKDILLEFNKSDLTIDGDLVSIKLTQEQTNCFKKGYAWVEVSVKTTGGNVPSPAKVTFYVNDVENDKVFG